MDRSEVIEDAKAALAVERVARALWRREHPGKDACYGPDSQEWHAFLDRARIAIEAYETPVSLTRLAM